MLIQSHSRGLYELSVMTEESKQLGKFIDKLNYHINALESLGENLRGWGSVLVHLITSKLDISTIKAWEGNNCPEGRDTTNSSTNTIFGKTL